MIKEIYEIREKCKRTEEKLKDLEVKLQQRKEELSQDELFNQLNDEYMKTHSENADLISEFTKKMDEYITLKGKENE